MHLNMIGAVDQPKHAHEHVKWSRESNIIQHGSFNGHISLNRLPARWIKLTESR